MVEANNSVFKFLPGIVLVQIVTVGLAVAAFSWSEDAQFVLVICLFAFVVSLLTSFWFSSIGRELYKDRLAGIREVHMLEKEQILINTEREKAAIMNESYKLREDEVRRAYAKANFKVGVIVSLAMVSGAVLIFSQFVVVGLTLPIAFGSALFGYLMRAKQERVIQESRFDRIEKPVEKPIGRNLLQSK